MRDLTAWRTLSPRQPFRFPRCGFQSCPEGILPKPRSRVRTDIALPDPAPDGEIYLSGRQAAAVVGVTQQAILLWRKFGWLAEAAQEPGGRRLLIYRYSDVLAADVRARGMAA